MNIWRHFDSKDWLVAGAGLVALAGLVTVLLIEPAVPQPPPKKSAQPKITWSEKEIEVILSPGETASRSISFTSDTDVANVVLEPVPELAPFLTLVPNSFANVRASTAQPVQVDFVIPEDAALGNYEGTIHLRDDSRTLPQTLRAVVRVWSAFTSAEVSFLYPPWSRVMSFSPDSGYYLLVDDPAISAPIPAFFISNPSGTNGLGIAGWFRANWDPTDILTSSGVMDRRDLPGGTVALTVTGTVPTTYTHGPLPYAFIFSETEDRALTIMQGQDSPLPLLGFSQEEISDIIMDLIVSIKFE